MLAQGPTTLVSLLLLSGGQVSASMGREPRWGLYDCLSPSYQTASCFQTVVVSCPRCPWCLIGSTPSPPASPRGKDGEESQVRGKQVNFFISSPAAIAVEVVTCALRARLRWSLDKAGLKQADVCCVLKQCLLFLPPVRSRSLFVG